MLRITVELWPGGWSDRRKVIAVMDLWNDGTGTVSRGDYCGNVYRMNLIGKRQGHDLAWLKDRAPAMRTGKVKDYPRRSKHVWHLVARMLKAMGYG